MVNQIQNVSSLNIEDNQLYFIGQNNEIMIQGLPENSVLSINRGFFQSPYAIDTLDGYVYVTDESQGLYVIKSYDNSSISYDDPKKIELGSSY